MKTGIYSCAGFNFRSFCGQQVAIRAFSYWLTAQAALPRRILLIVYYFLLITSTQPAVVFSEVKIKR